jgi:hypothetical protein
MKKEVKMPETEPNASTRETEEVDARQAHVSDRPPTTEEAEAAEVEKASVEADMKDVAEHEQEMGRLGATVKGEGEIK